MTAINTDTISVTAYIYEPERAYPLAEQQVLACLRALAGVCNGAFTWDGTGYNKIDTAFGKDLATKSYRLTPNQLRAANKMLAKYTGQLENMGLALPEKEALDAALSKRDAEFQKRDAQTKKAPEKLAGEVDYSASDGLLHLRFTYNPQAIEKMHEVAEEISKLRMRFDGQHIARVTFVKDDPNDRHWVAPLQALDMLKRAFPGFTLTDALVNFLREQEQERQRKLREAEAAAQAANQRVTDTLAHLGDLSKPIGKLNGKDITLYQHQIDVIKSMIHKGRFILAHDVGLGKTQSSLNAAKAIQLYERAQNGVGLHVFVVAQVGKRRDWMVEAATIGLHISFFSYNKIPVTNPLVPFILIVDEAQHFQNIHAQRTKNLITLAELAHSVFLLSGTPMKNGRPANIYPLLLMAHHPIAYPRDQKKSKFEKDYCNAQSTLYSKWDVTGATALARLNHEIIVGEHACLEYKTKEECLDLPPLLRIKKFADVSKEAARLFSDTLNTLWEQYEQRVQEKLNAFEEQCKAEYREAHADDEDESTRELDVTSLSFQFDLQQEEERVRKGQALVSLGFVRRAGEIAKIETVLEDAIEFIDEGKNPIIFCNFKETATLLANKLSAYITETSEETWQNVPQLQKPVKIVSGDYVGEKRDKIVDEFQNGNARAIICMFGAGGAGINLQKRGSRMILVSRAWTPGDFDQAEGRAHRLGQNESVVSLWPQLPKELSEIDIKIDAIIEQKQKNITLTLQGKEEEQAIVFDPVEILHDLFHKTARRLSA